MRVQRLATAPVFAELSKFGGGHISHTTGPIVLKISVLVLWVPKQHVYQVSLKSELVGFNPLGDLTQNDPSHDSMPRPAPTRWPVPACKHRQSSVTHA